MCTKSTGFVQIIGSIFGICGAASSSFQCSGSRSSLATRITPWAGSLFDTSPGSQQDTEIHPVPLAFQGRHQKCKDLFGTPTQCGLNIQQGSLQYEVLLLQCITISQHLVTFVHFSHSITGQSIKSFCCAMSKLVSATFWYIFYLGYQIMGLSDDLLSCSVILIFNRPRTETNDLRILEELPNLTIQWHSVHQVWLSWLMPLCCQIASTTWSSCWIQLMYGLPMPNGIQIQCRSSHNIGQWIVISLHMEGLVL